MILSGILHTSLGGFTVIRGVAPLGDLARCSEFNPEYQRILIDTHKEEIERFLSDGRYLFFPEVILSVSLQFDFNADKRKRSVNPITDIHSGKRFESNVNGLTVMPVATKLPTKLQNVGGTNAPQIAYIDLPEYEIENGLKLFRIDGNHRLSAANDAKPDEANYSLPTPFCIVLHDDATSAQLFEKVVFHNINGKQVPLTSEENLRLILEEGDGSLFDDKTLLESPSFGSAYYLARKLLAVIDDRYLPALKEPLKNRRSLALGLTQFLMRSGDAISKAADIAALDAQVPRLLEAIRTVDDLYSKHPNLSSNGCHGVLVAFLYFALHNNGQLFAAFAHWVTSNRIDHLAPSPPRRGSVTTTTWATFSRWTPSA